MLKYKIANEKDERYKEIEVQYGACRFCGQIRAIFPLEGPWDDEQLNECASEICTCSGAQNYVGIKERLECASEIIANKFGHPISESGYYEESCSDVCDLLNAAAKAVAYEKVAKISVKVNTAIKCDMSLSAKTGKIKIDRTITRKDTEES